VIQDSKKHGSGKSGKVCLTQRRRENLDHGKRSVIPGEDPESSEKSASRKERKARKEKQDQGVILIFVFLGGLGVLEGPKGTSVRKSLFEI